MPSPHQIGYIEVNGHKYKELHPVPRALLNFLRDALGALILLFAIIMPLFAFWLIAPQP